MEIPKEWALFPLKKNSKSPPLVKDWQNTRYPRSQFKGHQGNAGVACGNISGGLVVFDWDFRRGNERKQKSISIILEEYKKVFHKIWDTLIAETPHGYHFYYNIKNNELNNTSHCNGGYEKNGFTGTNTIRFGKYLQGLDTRANGGYVVIPPSVVDGVKYEWVNEKEVKEITLKQYNSIFEFFLVSDKDKAQNTIRQGFVDILKGDINPNELKQDKGNEHVLWKEMFHEAHSCCGLLPKDLITGLIKFQPGFDLEKTKVQLNNKKNIDYIFNGKRLETKKYNLYFDTKKEVKEVKKDLFGLDDKSTNLFLEGAGYIQSRDDGLFLEKVYKKTVEVFRVLEGNLVLNKLSYEHLNNNRILLTGAHGNKEFRTYPLPDLLNYLSDYIFHGNKGKDAVKFYILMLKRKIPEYKLSYVLGFNSAWNLPLLEEKEKFQILTATDKQKEAYDNAKLMIKNYTEVEKEYIIDLMKKFIDKTQMNKVKLSIIIGWAMAGPFRHVFINSFSLFPILCAYGDRSTGKSSVMEYFIVHFFGIHKTYYTPWILFSAARFEDVLSMSSFPVFIQEVKIIPHKTLSLIKEHATGISEYFRKKSARENDFTCLKSAPLAMDCNKLPKTLRDPAMNTKLTMVPFSDKEIIELDQEWNDLRKELKKYKTFSLYYDYTKDWGVEEIETRINLYLGEIQQLIKEHDRENIEQDNPRIIHQYIVIAFGIDLFNNIFDTNFDRFSVISLLLQSRTIMTRSILNEFYAFCDEAVMFDIDIKNPSYLNHKLESYSSKKGDGYLFNTSNKSDFQRFTQDKYSHEELVEQLRDALSDKEKYVITKHNTGKIRGIFVHEDFFTVVKKGVKNVK